MSWNDDDLWFEKWYFSFRPINLKGWAVVAITMACFFALSPFMFSDVNSTAVLATAAFIVVFAGAGYMVYRHIDL